MAMGGDKFAAEYLLMNAVAKVHSRHSELVLGNITFNFTGLNTQQVKHITTFLGSFVSLLLYLPLSLYTLESSSFSPRKNYDTNQLEGGLL